MARSSVIAAICVTAVLCILPQASAQASLSASLRNSSTLPVAAPSIVVNPWDNHHQYPPVYVPINSTISFLWTNDDHGVYLLNNDQCPENFTSNMFGMEELFPVTTKTAGTSNYTTTLTKPGIYYFACQQGVHCLQGQRMEVTVYDPTQGLVGSVAQYAPGPGTSAAPSESHFVSAGRKLM